MLNMWSKDIKKTKSRLAIMGVLELSKHPLSAQSIFDELNGEVWLSTIYRTLEIFEKHDMVNRIVFSNKEKAMYELAGVHHRHFAHCLMCHKIIEIQNCPMTCFEPEISEQGFQILGHNLEVTGYCSSCVY